MTGCMVFVFSSTNEYNIHYPELLASFNFQAPRCLSRQSTTFYSPLQHSNRDQNAPIPVTTTTVLVQLVSNFDFEPFSNISNRHFQIICTLIVYLYDLIVFKLYVYWYWSPHHIRLSSTSALWRWSYGSLTKSVAQLRNKMRGKASYGSDWQVLFWPVTSVISFLFFLLTPTIWTVL